MRIIGNQFLMAQILKEYVACEAGRIDINSWVDSAIENQKNAELRADG